MSAPIRHNSHEHDTMAEIRAHADQAFSRAAGAPLVEGNHVRLLKDARENYPAWLDAIRATKRHIHFESYILHEDNTGRILIWIAIALLYKGYRLHRRGKQEAGALEEQVRSHRAVKVPHEVESEKERT